VNKQMKTNKQTNKNKTKKGKTPGSGTIEFQS
jgi:hypothetical protein